MFNLGNKITVKKMLQKVYPVGSIYMSVNSTSPATLFGGTWEQIQDRFLLAAGSTYSAGATGGEATHTLTVDEIPSHNHALKYYNKTDHSDADTVLGGHNSAGGGSGGNLLWWETPAGYVHIANKGGSQAHNNMPPYLTVYVWKRTA